MMWDHRIKTRLKRLQYLVYPQLCNVCGLVDHRQIGICEQCLPTLPSCGVVCSVCGLTIGGKPQQLICGQCQIKRPYYDRLVAPYWYQAPLKQLIVQFKYHQRWQNADLLIELFCMSNIRIDTETVILPIPSHPARVRERGCNSVFELLRILSRRYHLFCDYDFLKRTKNTALQADKTDSERKRNIKNAFTISQSKQYKKVILFDDVVTTGATVNEASRCLRKSGVEDIEVWTLARTRLSANSYK